jgi:hypothetical protein
VEIINTEAFDSKISSGYQYKVNLPDSLIDVGFAAFNNCIGIEELNLGNGIQSIDTDAFRNLNRVRNLIIPNSVTDIQSDAFDGMTNIEYLNAQPSLNYQPIGGLFKDIGSRLTHLVLNTCIPIWSGTLGGNFKTVANVINLEIFPAPYSSVVGAVSEDYSGTSGTLIIHEGITSIYDNCFKVSSDYRKITTLLLPNSLIQIGSYAFYSALNLQELILSPSINNIGDSAFGYCKIYSINLSNIQTCQFYYHAFNCRDGNGPSSQITINNIKFGNRNAAPN